MKKNPNHPSKGSRIRVEPIRSLEDVATIRRLLARNSRDLLLFTMGINSSLRIGDILQLKVGEVRPLELGDSLSILESRSAKLNFLVMNKTVYKALRTYLRETNPKDGDYLFRSRKGENRPLTIGSVNALVKSWARAIHLSGNFGAHSLRKTFGYIQRVHYGVGLDILTRRFNHSSPCITRQYLGIGDKLLQDPCLNEI